MNKPVSVEAPRRLLIIDDNEQIHNDFRKIIRAATEPDQLAAADALLFGEEPAPTVELDLPNEIDSALQGQDGVAMVEKALTEGRPYMVAFVDMRMPPGWDGLETIRNLWKVDPHMQVVICSAYSDRSWQEINNVLGKKDNLIILKKPFENEEVLQLVQTLTRKWLDSKASKYRIGELEVLAEEHAYQNLEAHNQLQAENEYHAEVKRAWLEAEERFQGAFEAATAAQAILRSDTLEHTSVNANYLSLLGLPRAEVVGFTLTELNLAGEFCPLGKVVAECRAGQPVQNRLIEMTTFNGQKKSVLASLSPMSIQSGHYWLLSLLDANELREKLAAGL